MPPIYVSGKKKGLRPGSTKMSHHSFFEVAKPAQAHTAQKRAMKRQFECEQCFEKLVNLICAFVSDRQCSRIYRAQVLQDL